MKLLLFPTQCQREVLRDAQTVSEETVLLPIKFTSLQWSLPIPSLKYRTGIGCPPSSAVNAARCRWSFLLCGRGSFGIVQSSWTLLGVAATSSSTEKTANSWADQEAVATSGKERHRTKSDRGLGRAQGTSGIGSPSWYFPIQPDRDLLSLTTRIKVRKR